MSLHEKIDELTKTPLGSEDDIRVKLVIPFFKLLGYNDDNYELSFPIKGYSPHKRGRKPEADVVFFGERDHNEKTSLIVVETKKRDDEMVEQQARFYSTNLWVPFYLTWEKYNFNIYQIRNFDGITHLGSYSLKDISNKDLSELTATISLVAVKKFCEENEIKRFTINETTLLGYLNEYKSKYFDFLNKYSILRFNKELKISDQYVQRYFKEHRKINESEIGKDFSLDKHPEEYETHDVIFLLEEIVENENFVLIIGNPGTGKTTELKRLCLDMCKNENLYLPVFIPIRRLIAQDLKIKDFILQELKILEDSSKINLFFDFFLYSGKLVIFADGLDELDIENPEIARKKLKLIDSELQEIIRDNPENKIICSVRSESLISVYTEITVIFKNYDILPLTKRMIISFIRKWFSDEVEVGNKLISQLRESNIKNLSKNPLLLSLICIHFDRTMNLPQRVSELYKRAINVLLEEWDATRRIGRNVQVENLTSDKIKDLLSEISLLYHRKGIACFDQENLIKNIAKKLPIVGINSVKAKSAFDFIRIQTGLLCSWTLENYYAFPHISFQSFFVAKALRDREDGYEEIMNHINNPFWRQVLFFYTELGDASIVLKKMLELKDSILYDKLFIMAECLSRGLKFLKDIKLREKIISKLKDLSNKGDSSSYYLKKKAIKYLAKIKLESAKNILTELLYKDKKLDLDSYAIKYVSTIVGVNKAIEIFENHYLNDEDFNKYTLNIIDYLPIEEGIIVLENLLNSSINEPFLKKFKKSNNRIRYIVNKYIEIGQESVLEYIIKLLEDSQIPNLIRRKIALSLGYLQIENRITLLEKLLENKKIPSRVKIEIAPLCGPFNEKAKQYLISLIKNENEDPKDTRRFAANALSYHFQLNSQDIISLKEILTDSNPLLHYGTIVFLARKIYKSKSDLSRDLLIKTLEIWKNRQAEQKYENIKFLLRNLEYLVLLKTPEITSQEIYDFVEKNLLLDGYDENGCPRANVSFVSIYFKKFLDSFPNIISDDDLKLIKPFMYRQALPCFSHFILSEKYDIKLRKKLLIILINSTQRESKNIVNICWQELSDVWNQLEMTNPLKNEFFI